MPFTGRFAFGASEALGVVATTVEAVNERSDLLPNTRLTFVVADSMCDSPAGTSKASEMFEK